MALYTSRFKGYGPVQVQIRVKLSSDPLIEYLDFCMAIAEAVCPTGETGLQGLDCVIGKIVTHYIPIPAFAGPPVTSPFYYAWQSVLVSEDGRTLDRLLPSEQASAVDGGEAGPPLPGASLNQFAELPWPSALADADRRYLAEVLPTLPPLRYPMSGAESARFMDAYLNMPNRPMWVPELVTDTTIKKRKHRQDDELMHHQQALQREFEAGRLIAVNARHAPVATLMGGTFIPRTQAIAYLERHGLEPIGPEAGEGLHGAAQEKPQDDLGQSQAEWRPGKRKLTPEREQELLAYYEELLENDVDAPVKKTAEKFAISRRHVSTVVDKQRLARQQGRIDQLLAGTPR